MASRKLMPDAAAPPWRQGYVLGVPLQLATYAGLAEYCQDLCQRPQPAAVDFSNTQIVTWRRHDPWFAGVMADFDYCVPDGMPLVWCLNRAGAGLKDRVYGPTFMRHCILASPAPFTHYFLGGTPACLERLVDYFKTQNPAIQIVGARQPDLRLVGPDHHDLQFEKEEETIADINRLSPDFLWLCFGAPKQQIWVHCYKKRLRRGVVLTAGFAFDVIAGTKKDAPDWMQRRGLTWLFRALAEPRRLGGRYLKFNSLFLWYLIGDGLRGKGAFSSRRR